MEDKKSNCTCGSEEYMVLACSGASDVGHVTDLVARKLRDNGVRKMSCLALVGAGIEKSIESFKDCNVLVIDGCPVDCGKKIMERNGITNYKYFRLSDHGFEKGSTPPNEENIQKVYEKAEVIY